MKTTEARTASERPDQREPRRLVARLRAEQHNERGDLVLEALIAMFVIGAALMGYVLTSRTVEHVQRSQTSVDIVAQQAQGVLQAAQSMPWDRLGFNPADQPTTPVKDVTNTYWTVKHAYPVTGNADLAPTKTVERGGVTMTQRTDVVWTKCIGAPCSATTNAAAFGTKKVIVTMTFKAPGNPRDRVSTYTLTRSSTTSEAMPRAIPSGEALAAPTTSAPSPTAPTTTPTTPTPTKPPCPSGLIWAAPNRISWNNVSSATSYEIWRNNTAKGILSLEKTISAPATSTTTVYTQGGAYTYSVRPRNAVGLNTTCGWTDDRLS